MKQKLSLLLLGTFFINLIAIASPSAASAATANLVYNPSMEISYRDGSRPQGWARAAAGSNSYAFRYYRSGGVNNSRYVRVDVANYKSGYASWFNSPIAVQGNATYDLSLYYRSNLSTSLIGYSYDARGRVTKNTLATLGAYQSSWKKHTIRLNLRNDARKFQIMQRVTGNGYLKMDHVSLVRIGGPSTPKPPTTPPQNNGLSIANPSLETGAGNQPANWTSNAWGTNTPSFQYVTNDGHAGNRSAKVTISGYTDGDAKWFFNPITTLVPGKDYRFTIWYKGNVPPKVVARFTDSGGVDKFFGMQPPLTASTTQWTKYTDVFNVPLGTVSTTAFMFLDKNGWLQVDDVAIHEYKYPPFNRGLVSLTFDDGFEGNVTNALPKLNSLGLKSTQCYATGFIQGDEAQEENVLAFKNAGHEICSHTITHPMLTTLTTAQVNNELQTSRDYLRNLIGQPTGVKNFALPFGDYNASVNERIKVYYSSSRTVDEGFNARDNFDRYRVKVQNMTPTTTLAQYQAWVNKAKADKTWLVLVYHRILPAGETPDPFDTFQADFNAQMNFLAGAGITVKTYDAALAEITPQL